MLKLAYPLLVAGLLGPLVRVHCRANKHRTHILSPLSGELGAAIRAIKREASGDFSAQPRGIGETTKPVRISRIVLTIRLSY